MSLWDAIQQIQIHNLKGRQTTFESETERAAGRTRAVRQDLLDRIERLTLVTEAMWELLSERTNLTLADLATRVREIDARDGQIDGRHGPVPDAEPIRCPSCQAAVPRGKATCQFCGADVPAAKADPFRA